MTEAECLSEVVDVMQQHVLTTLLDARYGRPRQSREARKFGLGHLQFFASLGNGSAEGNVNGIWLNHVTRLFQTHHIVNVTHMM